MDTIYAARGQPTPLPFPPTSRNANWLRRSRRRISCDVVHATAAQRPLAEAAAAPPEKLMRPAGVERGEWWACLGDPAPAAEKRNNGVSRQFPWSWKGEKRKREDVEDEIATVLSFMTGQGWFGRLEWSRSLLL